MHFCDVIIQRLNRLLPVTGRVSRNSVFSVTQSIVGVGTYFLAMRYVISVAGLEGVGLWSITVGSVAMVRALDLSGANGLARMVAIKPDAEESKAAYIDTMSIFIFMLYVVLVLVLYVPALHIVRGMVSPASALLAGNLLTLAMVSLPINVVGLAQLSAIDGIGRADIRSVLNIGGFLVYGLFVSTLVRPIGVLGLAVAQIIQYVAVLIFARMFLSSRLVRLRLLPVHFSRGALFETVHYGLRLQAASVPMALFDPLSRILVGRWAGLDALGIYDLSYKLAGNTRTLVQAGLTPLIPEFTRLWSTDTTAARCYHAGVSSRAMRTVALAFTTVILASPAFSWFLLSYISWEFLFNVSVLSLAWGVASCGLTTQLYARAAGLLRWSIIGQWCLLVLGVGLMYAILPSVESVYAVVAVAAAIAIGHLIAFFGESRLLVLTPYGDGSSFKITVVALVGFVAVAAAAAVFAVFVLRER